MKKKSSKALQTVITMIPGFLLGIILGFFIMQSLGSMPSKFFIIAFIGVIASVICALIFSIALHEAGHLIFGLITGYKFSSYRIFSLMWLKDKNGKIRLKRFSIAGTGGQCLMSPPDIKDGKLPTVLYNLGGVIANAIACVIFLILFFVFFNIKYVALIMMIFFSINITFVLSNGIPMSSGGIDNDAKNALSIRKDIHAIRAFWIQMKVNEETSKGKRLKDMPEEWFKAPAKEKMQNSMIATLAVLQANRLLDQKNFEESEALMAEIIEEDNATLLFYKQLLTCDRIYIELITKCRDNVIEDMLTKNQQAIMKAMKKYPSIIRTEYTYMLLLKKDKEKASKILSFFEKIAKKYPHKNEIDAERELINIAIERANERFLI